MKSKCRDLYKENGLAGGLPRGQSRGQEENVDTPGSSLTWDRTGLSLQHLSLVGDILNRQPKQNLFGYPSTLAFNLPSTFSQQLNGSVIPAPGCKITTEQFPRRKMCHGFPPPVLLQGNTPWRGDTGHRGKSSRRRTGSTPVPGCALCVTQNMCSSGGFLST